ncbi:TPA: hypothetical protein I7721_21810, partial [Vibrio vulnificus]|nr:hypothetical protein [Vibrio vulnificus]
KTTVKATMDSISAQAAVSFVAGAPDTDKSSLAVSPESIVADNSAESAITLTLKDANDNLVSGKTVAFATTLDNKKTTISATTDNGDGTYSATIKGTLAGAAVITVRVGGESFAVTGKTVTLTADSSTAKLTNPGGGVSVVTTGAVADGKSKNSVKVTVTDTNGNGVSGQRVTLSADNSAVVAASAVTGSDGSVTVPVTTKKAGKATVTATLNKIEAKASVDFVAGAPDTDKSALAVSPESIVADNTAESTITLTLKDANDNPVSGQTVAFATTLDNKKTTISATTDNGDGTYSATIKGTLAGAAAITVKVGGESFAVTGKTVTLTADSTTAKLSNPGGGVTVVTTGAVADGESENSVKVTVTDTNGNGVSGKTVTLSADNSAVVAASAVTGSDGSVTVPVTTKKAGKATVTATLNKIEAKASVDFVAGAPDTSKSSLAVSPDTIVADNTAESAITLTLKDANDNLISGQTVAFATTLDNKKTTISATTDNGDGTYSATIKGTLAGAAAITVRVGGESFAVTGKTVRLIGDSSRINVTKSELSVSPDTIVADNTAESTITLTLKDDNDNGVIGQTVAFSTTLDNTKTTISSVTDNDDGTYSATIKGTLAGNAPVAVKVNNKTFSVTGKTVVLTPDASGVSATKSALAVSPESIVADNTAESTITLTLKDANDNPVSGQTVAFATTLDNKKTTISATKDNGDGTYSATIKGTLAGEAVITVKVNDKDFAVTGKTVTLTADSTTAKLSNPGGGVTVVTTGAVADGESENSVKVTVTDTNGNGVSGKTVTLSADNSAVVAASAVTGSDGSVTVSVTTKKAGKTTVKATMDSISAQAAVSFVAGAPDTDKSALAVSPESVVADNTAESAITLTLKDANDNPATGLTVVFESSLDSKKTTISATKDNGDGTYSATIKGTLAGKADITVKVGGESFAVTGKTVTLTADSTTAKLSNP